MGERLAHHRDGHLAATRSAFLLYSLCKDAKRRPIPSPLGVVNDTERGRGSFGPKSPASISLCLLAITLIATGCSSKSPTAAKTTPPPPSAHPWILSCNDPNNAEPALLWNGQIGVRIARDGTGVGSDGKPLPFFAIDEYETTGEEKITVIANPLVVKWTVDNEPVKIEDGYKQDLHMRTGVLTTSWKTDTAKFEVTSVMHPTQRIIAQRWSIEPLEDFDLSFSSSVDAPTGFAPKLLEGNETEAIIEYTKAGAKLRLTHKLDAAGEWSTQTNAFMWHGSAKKGRPIHLERVVSMGWSPNYIAMVQAQTPNLKGMGLPPFDPPNARSYKGIEAETSNKWAERWQTDIEIKGPVEDQQAIRSFLFYLRSGVAADGAMGISPMGLSDAQYNGHVFWDADIWVFPALALIDPDSARSIPGYRFQTEPLAKTNATTPNSIKFPWESSVSGKEVAPTPFRKEVHINGSVLWGLQQSASLDLVPQPAVDSIGKQVANYYRALSVKGPEGSEIKDVLSPDEYMVASNDLYTNLLAQWSINRFLGEPTKFKLPSDEESFLTYDGDKLRSYKQAAAVLSIYPLQYPEAEKQAKKMMERFASKTNPKGPAMSESVHALIWARIGETDRAYGEWQKSWRDFVNPALLLFSEKRTKDKTYFTTGAAGSLQTVLYGFLGFRIDSKKEPGFVWSKKLRGESWLTAKPHLPKEWTEITLKNFRVLGQRFTITATHAGTHVTQGES